MEVEWGYEWQEPLENGEEDQMMIEGVEELEKQPLDKEMLYKACPACPNFHFIYTTPFDNALLLTFMHATYASFKKVMGNNGTVDFKFIPNKKNNKYQNECQLKYKNQLTKAKVAPKMSMRRISRIRPRRSSYYANDQYDYYCYPYYDECEDMGIGNTSSKPKPKVHYPLPKVQILLAKQMKKSPSISKKTFDRTSHKKKHRILARQCGYTIKGGALLDIERRKSKRQQDRGRRFDRDTKCFMSC